MKPCGAARAPRPSEPRLTGRCSRHSATGRRTRIMARIVALLLLLVSQACAEILTPPYFNLALGKKITATATCGDEGRELYCKLVGANADHDQRVIQGQVCVPHSVKHLAQQWLSRRGFDSRSVYDLNLSSLA